MVVSKRPHARMQARTLALAAVWMGGVPSILRRRFSGGLAMIPSQVDVATAPFRLPRVKSPQPSFVFFTGLLAIHSVCVDAAHRRQGVASRLLRAYLAYVQGTTPQLREVRLICKEQLVPLYGGAGFAMVGPSCVVHGQDPWLEMRWAPQAAGEAAAAAAEDEGEEAEQKGGEEQQ